ncbi:MAG TPA: hypothetical protein VGP45_05755 [Marinobacter sp.]|nr:hypothetical protein [Marinobacter sp.]
MAEPAYQELEEFVVPEGGIADFIVEDDEIERMDREDAERAFGQSGIANFQDVASRMADYGRYGDNTLAHVQTGEIVIPAALIAENPTLKQSIFDDLRARGIEDPDRYVVGSSENSINPVTGMPEFFLKKLFKGVKKAFKKVGKFLKKASTVVLPVALSFVMGPVFGSALGSGIASLINGGSIKDAFKAAAISGAAGGLLAGAGSVMKGGTFMGGVKGAVGLGGAVPPPTAPVTDAVPSVAGGELTAKGLAEQAAAAKAGSVSASLPPVTDAVPDFVSGAASGAPAAAAAAPSALPGAIDITAGGQPFAPLSASQALSAATPAQAVTAAAQPGGLQAAMAASPSFAGTPTAPLTMTELVGQAPSALQTALSAAPTAGVAGVPTATAAGAAGALGAGAGGAGAGTRNLFQRSMDYMVRGGQTPDQIIAAQKLAEKGALQEGLAKYGYSSLSAAPPEIRTAIIEAGKEAAKAAGPGLFQRLGPTAALAGAGLYAGSFFETPEMEEITIGPDYTSEDVLRDRAEEFYGIGGQPYAVQYTPMQAPQMQYTPLPPQMIGAEGGEVYPRRNGGIMPYEGTPDEDSVRALLMPGEFVMTKDAVRGLGNGSVDRGIKNMYSVMRDLESRGRVA